MVNKDEQQIYKKYHEIEHKWDSSFAGAIAITNAQLAYPMAIQKLLASFLKDPELKAALK